jgi:hypothetical protein
MKNVLICSYTIMFPPNPTFCHIALAALNWDRGLVNCGTNILHAVDSLEKMRFMFIARHLQNLLRGTDTVGGKGHVLPFALIAQL